MSAEAPIPNAGDEEFLDRAFERAVASIEDGTDPTPDDLLEGREHLRAETEALLRTARQAAVFRPRAMPEVAGFSLLHEIGRGGMGAVYLARQEALGGRRVALKVLPSSSGISSKARARFLAEARAIAHMRHPNVVTVHDVIATAGVHAYAMEWIDGASLGDVIGFLKTEGARDREWAADRPLPDLAGVREFLGSTGTGPAGSYPVFICRIGVAIARALAELHRTGLVHRDVKPSNILLRKDGTPLLSDFGLVHATDGAMTQSGRFAGTMAYASPEQLGGDPESLDARSDIYGLGVTLYQALTLHLPFDGLRGRSSQGITPAGMLRAIGGGRAAPLRAWNRRLPRDLETILAKSIDADPTRRYASADDLADDIERMLSLQPIRARRPGWIARGVKFVRRNRAATLGIGAGSLASLALASAAVVYIFIVPRWITEHVRDARLALLDPGQANGIFNAIFFGVPSRDVEASSRAPDAEFDQAIRHYDAALRWVPFDRELRAERDVVVAANGAEHGRNPTDVRSAGLLAYLRGDSDAALEHWERFEERRDLATAPDPLVEAALGFLYLAREEYARAYPRLREANRSFPRVAFLTTYLADAAVQCGDLATAERLLLGARTMDRPDPLGSSNRVLADLRAAQGRDAEAEALYRRADPATPASLHHARFLESRGRAEEAVEQYVRLASAARGARVRRECLAALERWWGALSHDERLRRILEVLDPPSTPGHSLIPRLRVVAEIASDTAPGSSEPVAGSRAASSPWPFAFFAALARALSSLPLQSRSLIELARTLEVHEMTRWSKIPDYPRPLKSLQLWAWRSPWPSQMSVAVDNLALSIGRQAGQMARGAAVLACLAAATEAQNCPDAPCFQGIGDLPGGNFRSFATCISSDGTTVGGGSSTTLSMDEPYDHEAFIWRADTGIVYLGDIPGNGEMGETLGLSADGSIAVGWSSTALGTDPHYGYPEAFRWTQIDGMVGLGDLPGGAFQSEAFGISDDGSLISGSAVQDAWRSATWTSAGSCVLRGGTETWQSFFLGMSRDGHWVTGRQDPDFTHSQSTRWSETLGMEVLDTVGAGYTEADGIAVSDNGVVVGVRAGVSALEGFVWKEGVGIQLLDDLPGGANSVYPYSILRDGTLIVGHSVSATGPEAAMWDETRAVHRLADVLTAAGVVIPPGWTLTKARDIVKNCYTISVCGEAINPSGDPEAWIARFPTSTDQPPIAMAGPDQSVAELTLVTLDGSSSSISCGPPSYSWSQLAGPSVTLDLTNPAQPTFTAPSVPVGGATLTFELVVSDGTQPSGPDLVYVSVADLNVTPFCFGDGTGHACPCGNTGSAGRGCQNSIGTGGALLAASGDALLSSDTLVLTASHELSASVSLFWQAGTEVSSHIFGDGVGCLGSPLRRMYRPNAVGGAATVPQGADLSVSARSAALGDVLSAGAVRIYQVFYRDGSANFCSSPVGSTFNTTGGLRVIWGE